MLGSFWRWYRSLRWCWQAPIPGGLFVIIIATACAGGSTDTTDGAASTSASPTTTLAGSPASTLTPFLEITEPSDGSTLSTSEVNIVGLAPPNTEVRRNIALLPDDSIKVDQDGRWEYKAKQQTGNNEFDFFLQESQSTRAKLTLTYTPIISTGEATTQPTPSPVAQTPTPVAQNCHPSYVGVCIPPPPPDLDCPQIAARNFRIVGPDVHNLDGTDRDGIGCES
jgi:hypothetical protein